MGLNIGYLLKYFLLYLKCITLASWLLLSRILFTYFAEIYCPMYNIKGHKNSKHIIHLVISSKKVLTKIVQRAAPKTTYFLSFWQNVQNENIVRILSTFTGLFLLENLFWDYNFSKLGNNNRISFSAISIMLNFYHQRNNNFRHGLWTNDE